MTSSKTYPVALLLYICLCAYHPTVHVAVAQGRVDEDATGQVVRLIELSCAHGWINQNGLARLHDAVSSDQPSFVTPFDDLGNIDQGVMHRQLTYLLAEGPIDFYRIKAWLADRLEVQHRTASRRQSDADDTARLGELMTFARVPAGHMRPPDWITRLHAATRDSIDFDEFEIMTHPVTQAQWWKWMRTVPFEHTHGPFSTEVTLNDQRLSINPTYPAENITYNDILSFIDQLNHHDRNYHYWLPRDDEWIYVYTGGGQEQNLSGWHRVTADDFRANRIEKHTNGTAPDGSAAINFLKYGWFAENSNGHPQPVGKLLPIVLHHPEVGDQAVWDMPGNVAEFTIPAERFFRRHNQLARFLGRSFKYSTASYKYANHYIINPWDQIADGFSDHGLYKEDEKAITAHSDVGFRLARRRITRWTYPDGL